MRNGLNYVTVHDLHVISEREVVVVIDIISHVHLRDPAVVKAAMDDFMARLPGLEYWEAEARNGYLYVKAEGTIDQVALARWRK